MQSDPKLNNVYAESLVELAEEQKTLEQTDQELREVAALLHADTAVWAFFRSPVMDPAEKVRAMERSLKPALSATLYNFLGVLARRRRFDSLPQIALAFSKLADEKLGRRHVRVQSARALTDSERKDLSEALTAYLKRKVLLDEEVQASLIGGVVVRSGDLVIDSSISSRLKRLRQILLARKVAGEAFYEN
ncbi:MAG: ATP synthase F1 subunit delta [Leptospirales bacterium]|nr:ATP synthase F1 subunit delta [Leptospirales bacterium]